MTWLKWTCTRTNKGPKSGQEHLRNIHHKLTPFCTMCTFTSLFGGNYHWQRLGLHTKVILLLMHITVFYDKGRGQSTLCTLSRVLQLVLLWLTLCSFPLRALGKRQLLFVFISSEQSALGRQAGVSWSAASLTPAPTISSAQSFCSVSPLFSLTFSLALFRLQQQQLSCFLFLFLLFNLYSALFSSWTVLFRLPFSC